MHPDPRPSLSAAPFHPDVCPLSFQECSRYKKWSGKIGALGLDMSDRKLSFSEATMFFRQLQIINILVHLNAESSSQVSVTRPYHGQSQMDEAVGDSSSLSSTTLDSAL